MKDTIRALEREEVQPAREAEPQAEAMPAGEALHTADLRKADLEPITDAELQRMLGSGSICRFAYAPDDAPVAAATASGAGGSRGLIKLHGRLVPAERSIPDVSGRPFRVVQV